MRLKCFRCGYVWRPIHKSDRHIGQPKHCGACLSKRWNVPGPQTRDWRRYIIKKLVRSLTMSAMQSGQLIRQPCKVCGAYAEPHHLSYGPDSALHVEWLCTKHHGEAHRKKASR